MKLMIWKPLALFLTVTALCTGAMAQEVHTPLGDAMEKIGDSFKTISRGMRTPELSDLSRFAGDVAIIKENALKAKNLVPQLIEESGDQKAVMLEAYQKKMGEFIATVTELEKAVAANEVDRAAKLVAKMNETRKASHEKFQKPDENR